MDTLWHSIFYLCAHTYAHFNFVWMDILVKLDIDEGMTLLPFIWTPPHIFSIFFQVEKLVYESCSLCHMSTVRSLPSCSFHILMKAWGHKKQCHFRNFSFLYFICSSLLILWALPAHFTSLTLSEEMKLNIYELGMRNDAVCLRIKLCKKWIYVYIPPSDAYKRLFISFCFPRSLTLSLSLEWKYK